MKKRTKQVQLMVDEVNRGLKRRKVVEQNKDENFLFFSNLLLKADCYQGFNWVHEYTFKDASGNEKTIEKLCGTSDPEKVRQMNGYVKFY